MKWWPQRTSRSQRSEPLSATRLSSVTVGVAVPAVLATLAIINPGYDISDVDLNDGSVWITNTTELKAGRYHAKVKEINGGVVPTDQTFDVLQDGQDVLIAQGASLSRVDPANVAFDAVAQIPAGAATSMAAGVLAVTDDSGSVWVQRVSDLTTIDDTTPPLADFGDGAVSTVDRSGIVHAWDPGTGAVSSWSGSGAVASEPVTLKDAVGLPVGARDQSRTPQLTAVGSTPFSRWEPPCTHRASQ